MSETGRLTVTYTPLETGDGESFWIRLEQEKPEDETLTVAEAAEIIDSLYDMEPCEDGMGGGGEEADEDNDPNEEELDAALASMLRRAGVCDEAEYWEAVVNVYRSHRQPGYELRGENVEVYATTPAHGTYRQVVEASGSAIDLDMPYDGGLTGIPAGVNWEVRGSTVNLSRPVNGRLVLRYGTCWERVTLRISAKTPGSENGVAFWNVVAATGGGGGKSGRSELPPAAVAAFWRDLAAGCELEPPEQDDELSENERMEICAEPGSGGGGGSITGKDCWKTVIHYNRCSCSGRRVDEWEEQVSADCGGAAGGSNVGGEEAFGNYVHCDGEQDELSTVEYYMKRCCKPPSGIALPRCRRTYAIYHGGSEIENGPEHWRNIYGENVSMIAVSPPGGVCGDKITEYNVPQRNCCDEVEPMTPEPDNPTTIRIGQAVELCVDGGNYIKTWRTSGGLYMGAHEHVITVGSDCMTIAADEDACDSGVVQVDDGCSRVNMRLTLENPGEDMYLEPEHAMLASEGQLHVGAVNAKGEVQWSATGGLKMLSRQGEKSALFEAPDNFCGMAEVTASDACMRIASMTVQGTAGRWVEQHDFDPCSAPWGGTPKAISWGSSTGYVIEAQGWRAYVGAVSGNKNVSTDPGCEHRGSCQTGIDAYSGAKPPCDYSGRELITNIYGESLWSCTPTSVVRCYPLCRNTYECVHSPRWGDYETQNIWYAQVQYISRLWKWECEDDE